MRSRSTRARKARSTRSRTRCATSWRASAPKVSIQERFDLVEEGRNAGKTLKEIGEEQKLKFFDVEAVDKDNKTPDGKPGIDIPDAAVALKQIFVTGVGTQPDAVELPGSTSVWFDVQSVRAEPKQKPFDEVKAEVKTAYIDKETRKLLNELAQKLVDRLKGGEAFEKVAADAGTKAELSNRSSATHRRRA